MKIIKKIILFLVVLVLLSGVAGGIYLYNAKPALPSDADAIISAKLKNQVVSPILGTTGYATSQDLKIWYELQAPKQSIRGTVILIAGHSENGLTWPQSFVQPLLDSGFQVIRFDHRGTGLSDDVKNWDRNAPYSLNDMSLDVIAIMDALNIEEAHMIGVSMGGMISQILASDYSSRVASLTSIMSTASVTDYQLPPISSEVAINMIKIAAKYAIIPSEKNTVKMKLAHQIILRGGATTELDIAKVTEQVLYDIREHNGYRAAVGQQHQKAISTSSSRYEKLSKLQVPVLYIHGENDPLIPIEHGKKCAQVTNGAESFWVKNMGHRIPSNHVEQITSKVLQHIKKSTSVSVSL